MTRTTSTSANKRTSRSTSNAKSVKTPVKSRFSSVYGEIKLFIYAALAFGLAVMFFTWSSNDPSWISTAKSGVVNNRLGTVGAHLSSIFYYLFGMSSWWFVVLLLQRLWVGYKRLMKKIILDPDQALPKFHWEKGLGFAVLFIASMGIEYHQFAALLHNLPSGAGGIFGAIIYNFLHTAIGIAGTVLLLVLLLAVGLSLFFSFSWFSIAEALGSVIDRLFSKRQEIRQERKDRKVGEIAVEERAKQVEQLQEQVKGHESIKIEPQIKVFPVDPKVKEAKQQNLFKSTPKSDNVAAPLVSDLPALDLLDPPEPDVEGIDHDTIEYTSRLIEKKLADFGVKVTVIEAQAGPVITRYEIEPATGVKGSQIVNLSKDLARALSLVSIRVVETIPGKNVMGIELPNPRRQMVRLSEILSSKTFNDNASPLTVALGKDIAGNPLVADIAKTPHMLVAGATGAGKSVGINAMILSLLYKADPSQVRLIMIDPKMLEMSVYEGIPHLLAPVVTDMRQAANALNWCVAEMEKRYKLMSKMGVRNVAGYNNKIREAAKKGDVIPNPFSLTPDAPEPLKAMPLIVVIVDELADLMMQVGKKIEELIARIAQKARAAGIHLVLATQRPSVDVITGLIKANVPTRISFRVSSKIDSRTILDQMGAETLLGNGDMLYMPTGAGFPTRVHGAFVSDEEVHRVVDYLKEQGEPEYIDGILEGGVAGETGDGVSAVTGMADAEGDPLYDQAVAIVLKSRRPSISFVQRNLRIGYNRAANLLEQMERSGIVSAMQSNGNREILAPAGPAADDDME